MPPTLHTDRLILRPPQRSDFEDFAALRADPTVSRYTSGSPMPLNDTWQKLLQYRGLWDIMGFGYWMARDRRSKCFVGTIGFGEFHRGLTPSMDFLPEAGWVLASSAHGQGYATEGVTAALNWLDTETAHTCTRCIIDPNNQASLRLAQKTGFHLLASTPFKDETVLMFERLRPSPRA